MMRSHEFICISLILSATGSIGISDVLEFTGSYWKAADSYQLTIDFDQSPTRLEWDGYPVARDGRQGEAIFREKAPPGRISFGFDLTEEEESVFKALKKGLHLCHNGHQMVLGTGLSNTVRIWHDGNVLSQQMYFHVEPGAILGRRMSEVPLDFQNMVENDGLSERKRSEWIEKSRELGADIAAWQEALNILTDAQTNRSEIPWSKLMVISQEAESSEVIDSFERDLAFAYETEPVLNLLLSQETRAEYFPEPGTGHILVRIDEIVKSDEHEWFSILPPSDLGANSKAWSLAPPAFLRLIEDYITGKNLSIEVWHQHGLWNLVESKTGYETGFLQRLKFIESSDWSQPLRKSGLEERSIREFRILELTFEENMSKCVVLTRRNNEARFTLLQVEDGDWKIIRQIDSADWEEYRWKEPLFK